MLNLNSIVTENTALSSQTELNSLEVTPKLEIIVTDFEGQGVNSYVLNFLLSISNCEATLN